MTYQREAQIHFLGRRASRNGSPVGPSGCEVGTSLELENRHKSIDQNRQEKGNDAVPWVGYGVLDYLQGSSWCCWGFENQKYRHGSFVPQSCRCQTWRHHWIPWAQQSHLSYQDFPALMIQTATQIRIVSIKWREIMTSEHVKLEAVAVRRLRRSLRGRGDHLAVHTKQYLLRISSYDDEAIALA